MKTRHAAYRKGVLLLIILALLAMFGLIAVAFVVISGQAQRSAKSVERFELATDPPPQLLRQAAMQVFRGSNSAVSVNGTRSLLEDMYGSGGMQGTIGGVTSVASGQLLEITSGLSADTVARTGGCVLTITGPLPTTPGYGQSTLIMSVNLSSATFQVVAFPDGSIPTGATFIINGAPFSGANSDYTAADSQHPLLAKYDENGNVIPAPNSSVNHDGVGTPDSAWVDLGMPVRATADGRLYKPQFAILCVDLDGRLNVNAHGCWAQAGTPALTATTSNLFAGGAGANLPRGVGYGPAEINLSGILGTQSQYQTLLTWRYPLAGLGLGTDVGSHRLSLNKWFLYGGDYWTGAANGTGAYGSPPDLLGTAAIGLDYGGRPIYVDMGQAYNATSAVACPYEFDLSAKRQHGAATGTNGNVPYSPAELERLLRPNDRDATSLPDRLARVSGQALLAKRNVVTTESWDVPVPSAGNADIPTQPYFPPQHVTDTLKLLLLKQTPTLTATDLNTLLPQLFAPELLAGRKMDLNRAFGNGRDDNSNGVVDESGPAETGETVSQYTSAAGGTTPATVSYDPTGTAVNSLQARQLYARYLYVLAMVLCDRTALDTQLGGAAKTPPYLAQWAVNVVDFYDRDSIMTPFQYDPTPFTSAGWGAPVGPPTSTTNLVWGCERPELLITETLAFHDRMTEDLATEQVDLTNTDNGNHTGSGTTTGTSPNRDPNFDQRLRPQGSLFVELYNPWTSQEPRPAELRKPATTDGVDLNVTSATGGSPVWRLAIVADATKDPEDDTIALPTIERTVYFVAPGTPLPPGGTVQFQPNTTQAANIKPIIPGRYAVIGPGEPTDTTVSTSYFGRKARIPYRRIELTNVSVAVYNNSTTDDLAGLSINSPIPVVINWPCRLSISEPNPTGNPLSPYPPNSPNGTAYTASGYSPPYDIPLDQAATSTMSAAMKAAIRDNKRTDGIKVIHLQRLANPLIGYDATTNPYRTIDSMPVDLTAFNGITSSSDPQVTNLMTSINFWSRQRGQNNDLTTTNILWRQEPLTNSSPKVNAPAPPTVSGFVFNQPLSHTLGFLNNPFGAPKVDPGKGDPSSPFPWLTWSNRPFVSPLELTLVPWTRSSQLCGVFATPGGNPYSTSTAPFSHLLNLLQSTAKLHRILEFVGVPSRFVGSEIQVNPTAATGSIFNPPFNKIPTLREPGKINLNTIYSEEVYNGLMSGLNGISGPSWTDFKASRDAKPFRSFTRDVNDTLLREGSTGQPLFNFTSAAAYNNSTRNPFFYYHGMQRLANLTTTRSNVYAVWITVGYFEVTPGAISTDHPDGYTLGAELDTGTGDPERHRSFFIFDRSIPVGFQRGQDLNVKKAILVDRFIE